MHHDQQNGRDARSTDPALSVIIPAWNEEKAVGRAIQSLQRAAEYYTQQRHCAAEIVVVDNNSSDHTADVAREQGTMVVFEPVNNIGKARNAGRAGIPRPVPGVLRR